MPITIEKEWAAVDGEDIVLMAESKDGVETRLREQGYDPNDYDIVALPKAHNSMFI